MNLLRRVGTVVQAARHVGLAAVLRYGLYRFGLVSGHYRRMTPPLSPAEQPHTAVRLEEIAARPPRPVVSLPEPEVLRWMLEKGLPQLLEEAREISDGKVRLFGAGPVPLDLNPHTPPVHWTVAQKLIQADIKDIWEPARLGWVYPLGRAYRLSGDERFCQAFWRGLETFRRLNPYNLGSNWISGQEVALRILALAFGWQVFAGSVHSTPECTRMLVHSLYEHACRIPPTLVYARAQKNNHLISEAVGLLTAGWMLQGLDEAPRWAHSGWHTLNHALEQQIAPDGTYTQQSMNYHRLMLEAALWAHALGKNASANSRQDEPNQAGKHPHGEAGFTPKACSRLAAAAAWLTAQVDPFSGRVPNLGANDGAHILPLASAAFDDYRPVAQAAGLAFSLTPGQAGAQQPCCLAAGPWDEQSLWLGLALPEERPLAWTESPGVHRLGNAGSWASLRAVHFHDRPSHADQLHVELWWAGQNIAMDAGTFRYNAPPPWDNRLAGTAVHNTIQVDGNDQMTRAGRFLWLDWAQARMLATDTDNPCLAAEHNGYRRLGIRHRRKLEQVSQMEWLVEDELLPFRPETFLHQVRLHWLTADVPFYVDDDGAIRLDTPAGQVWLRMGVVEKDVEQTGELAVNRESGSARRLSILRAGQVVYGSGAAEAISGWRSLTYSVREPALSIVYTLQSIMPVTLQSRWIFAGAG